MLLVGHGMLYFYHYVLHQVISQTNILLVPIDDKIQDKYSVLINLDYAAYIATATLLYKSTGAPHQIETLSYIAINIFYDNHGLHFYHYDIKSFLYIFFWSCIYDSNQKGYILIANTPDNSNRISITKTLTIEQNCHPQCFS